MASGDTNTFDLIILGGGTAGSLLASRLSSSTNFRILVLESGQNYNSDPNVSCPGYARNLHGNPKYDWQFQTQPEEGLNGRVISHPRGRLWGGSSAINSHALVYPSRKFHDGWDALLGGEGKGEERERWDWEGVGRYYESFQELQRPNEGLRKELRIGDFARGGEGGGGESGGIKASYPVTPHEFHRAWGDAMEEFGYSSLKDPRNGDVIGGSITANAIDSVKGERSHAGVEFLEPATKRENLVVRSNALVEKIIFDQEKQDGKLVATGVLFLDEESREKVTVHARKEVIVCAGTFGSPKILELSGIGQRERLATLGIECLYDLPGVGENLQDHLNFGPSVQVHDKIDTLDNLPPEAIEAQKKQYQESHTGPLAEMGAFSFSYLPLPPDAALTTLLSKTLSETSNPGLKAQYTLIANQILDPNEATATVFLTRKQRYTTPSAPAPGKYMTLLAMLSHPFSRGTSHVISRDAKTKPLIKFNYLTHPLDTLLLSQHMLQLNTLLTLPSLSRFLLPNGRTLPPKYPRSPEAKVEEMEGFVRQYAATNYHPTGTCAMMGEEMQGVVDAGLRVYGTGNVRVCDASVVSVVPRGNVLSCVYAVAGKGADVILRGLGVEV